MDSLDYKKILTHYIRWVGYQEGISFIEYASPELLDLSKEEFEALQAADKESTKVWT